jgi:hypothetical protein
MVLFWNLPDESISHAVVHGWSFDRQIAAATLEGIDLLAGQVWYLRELISNQGRKNPRRWQKWKPLRVPRPGDAPEAAAVKPLSIAEFRARIEEEGA